MSFLRLSTRFLCLLLLSPGCGTNDSADSRNPIQPFSDFSPVSETIRQEYPPSQYLFGIGQAESEQAAIEFARADLAKKIQVWVIAGASDLERIQGGQTDQLLSRFVTSHTNGLMKGTHIVEVHREEPSQLIRAVVVMSREEADRLNQTLGATKTSPNSLRTEWQSLKPIWVKAEGRVPFGPDTTLNEAAARSRDKARRQAVERAVGTFVKGQTITYNTTVTADVVRSIVRGLIIEEEILKEGMEAPTSGTEGVALFYVTKLRAKVKPTPPEDHEGLRLNVVLNRTIFHEGDEVQVAIVPSQDAFVYILNVAQNDTITMLFPNKFAHDNFLPAERELVFPDTIQRNRGIRLRTTLPRGEGKSIEKVKVLATSKRLARLNDPTLPDPFFPGSDSNPVKLADLMNRLAHLEYSSWTEMTIPYEIRR